jgi:hypothetical protein
MRSMLVPGLITASREECKAHSRQRRERQAQNGKEGSFVDNSFHDRELYMNDYLLNCSSMPRYCSPALFEACIIVSYSIDG